MQCKLGVQCRTPSRSDRFNGVTGVARGSKGRNRNLPWLPGKKDYKRALEIYSMLATYECIPKNISNYSKNMMSRLGKKIEDNK